MPGSEAIIRRRLDLRGQVQGVGFRPYVYRLAQTHGLAGFVANNANGAVIEVQGPPDALDAFECALVSRLPPLARIAELVRRELARADESGFRIHLSQSDGDHRPEVTPDAATCADCLRELCDPADRRYRYPFINCTNCGPRYSIIRDVPYDRPQTTMAVFTMCAACAREYHDPADRRFHAQPNACPACGPRLRWERTQAPNDRSAEESAADPLRAAAECLRNGGIVAVKGIGGYHLACRADREDVVARLRERKLRDGKPLAIMVPDLPSAARLCRLSPADVDALRSSAAPIVLAPIADPTLLAASVAPGCHTYGVMLPYTPLHHLLFAEGLGPLVMTSANLSGQPLTYRDEDARAMLADIADGFLVHDREIHRPIDDSVVVTFRDEIVPVRRARGYAPRPIRLALDIATTTRAHEAPARILAVGGELKSTACLLTGREAILSEHLGDLTHPDTYRHFVRAIDRLKQLCAFEPDLLACDLHPRYLSTEYAQKLGLPVVAVQHHHAHIASVMAEWGEAGPVIGLACDGTGYGTDGAVWGCEILRCERGRFERLGHLEYYPLVGGDRAALETWRPAAALLRLAGCDDWPSLVPTAEPALLKAFERQYNTGMNSPRTSSLGRVFDAVAALLGLCPCNRHEAEAAMALEAAAAEDTSTAPPEPFGYEILEEGGLLRLCLRPAIRETVTEHRRGARRAGIAARFHETIARLLADAAIRAARSCQINKIGLSGGCFANQRLLLRLVALLEAQGQQVLYHRQVPCGDGGLSLGQAAVAAWQASER